jgi:hypothetical protein
MEHPLRDRLATVASTRVLIAGDTHSNRGWVEHACATAAAHGCKLIIQLGDFGFDPNSDSGTRFLNAVSESCEQHGVELWWLDGNHENHFELAQMVADQTEPEPIWIRPHLWYLPRGTRLNIAGRTLGVLGGAFSVDWRQRTIGTSWWPNEVPTEASNASAARRSMYSSPTTSPPASTSHRAGACHPTTKCAPTPYER